MSSIKRIQKLHSDKRKAFKKNNRRRSHIKKTKGFVYIAGKGQYGPEGRIGAKVKNPTGGIKT